MANLTGPAQVFAGDTSEVDSSAQHQVGTKAFDTDGNEYVYLKGVANTVAGSWVTYDEAGVTALLAANAKGFVAVAMAAIVAAKYGWYLIRGTADAKMAANCGDNALIGREGADGVAGDGRAAGDEIIGAMSREATTDAALAAVQVSYPFVNDATGS